MAYNLPATYSPGYGYSSISGIGQQMFPNYSQSMAGMAAQPQVQSGQQNGHGLIWVDGEVGAKAYQLPSGWPPNQPIALWDTNDTVIYLKSINPMGMPNPLQKAHYKLEENRQASGVSGDTTAAAEHDMTQYVRKDDMERMKQEIMDAISNVGMAGTGTTAAGGTGAGKRTAKEV